VESSSRPGIDASRWFFPLAAGYGALVPLLSVLSMAFGVAGPPGLASPEGHSHEMLFGFAAAVVTGFLLRRTSGARLAGLLLAWSGARLFYLMQGAVWESWAAESGFFVLLTGPLIWRLAVSAKKWRNHATTVALAGLALLVLCGPLPAIVTSRPSVGLVSARAALLLFAVLLAFMGGRILAAVVAGPLRRAGADLSDRVQLPVETMQLLGLGGALALQWWARMVPWAGLLVIIAAVATVVRLLRWKKAFRSGGRELRLLGFGYLWLGAGLLALGGAMALAPSIQRTLLHLLAVGGLGTLTLVQMARVSLARLDRRASLPAAVWGAVGLIWMAAGLRVASVIWPAMTPGLWLFAAAAWFGAFAWCLGYQGVLMVKAQLATDRRHAAI